MAKYRISGGLAMTPDNDMKMLKKMSRQGWHLTGMRGIFYRFEQGQAHDYDYSLNLESNTNSEMMSFYEASGWTPVVVNDGYQIFRAEAGASPIFSDLESEVEMLSNNRRSYGKWSLILLCLMVICFIIGELVEVNTWVTAGPGLFLLMCFIFTFFPFIGYSISLYKKQRL